MADKNVVWLGSSKDDISKFPDDAKQYAGFQLRLVQKGLAPDDAKPMASVGAGTMEIRINTGDAYRVFYVAKFPEAIYVLHAFQKTTQQTAEKDLQLARTRYKAVIAQRAVQPSKKKHGGKER